MGWHYAMSSLATATINRFPHGMKATLLGSCVLAQTTLQG